MRALREGVRPDGASYYPAFPYPSFTKIVDRDARAIKAYLFSLPPVHRPNRMHDLRFPFNWRFLLPLWKLLFFRAGPFQPDPHRSAADNRGAYLVTAVAHCGECHTPRNWLGASEEDRFLAGTAHGPDGKPVPNITPDRATGIGSWSVDDIATLLKDGQKPDFDFVGGAMGEIVDDTAKLDDSDRRAIAVYLKSLAPIASPQAASSARQKE